MTSNSKSSKTSFLNIEIFRKHTWSDNIGTDNKKRKKYARLSWSSIGRHKKILLFPTSFSTFFTFATHFSLSFSYHLHFHHFLLLQNQWKVWYSSAFKVGQIWQRVGFNVHLYPCIHMWAWGKTCSFPIDTPQALRLKLFKSFCLVWHNTTIMDHPVKINNNPWDKLGRTVSVLTDSFSLFFFSSTILIF